MLPKINEAKGASSGNVGGPHVHKTLYDGNKNFWRTRESVDVRIIEHTDVDIIEIICFSVDKHEEADRIFISSDKLYKKLNNSELQEKVAGKREEYNRQRKRVPNEEIFRVLVRDSAVQWVLARLSPSTTTKPRHGAAAALNQQLEAAETLTEGAVGTETSAGAVEGDTNTGGTVGTVESSATTGTAATETNTGEKIDADGSGDAVDGSTDSESGSNTGEEEAVKPSAAKAVPDTVCAPRFHMDIIPLTGDPTVKADSTTLEYQVLEEPANIEVITVVRHRKKASKQEFNNALRNLRMDSQKLNAACSDAQRKAGLAVSSVDGFKNFASRMTYDPETMSIARWRWLKAGRRVILQNTVAAVTRRLERSSMNDVPAVGGDVRNTVGNLQGGLDDSRRLKPSNSTTKLPSLGSSVKALKRNSMGSVRRLTRGSREPRPLDDFSKAFSGALKEHADVHKDGKVMGTSSSLPVL